MFPSGRSRACVGGKPWPVAGSLGGPAGMVLAIPGYTLLRIVGREFLQQFPWVQALTKSIDRNGQEQG